MKKVLVTGASGFIGTHICRLLELLGYEVRAALRGPDRHLQCSVKDVVAVGEVGSFTQWEKALHGVGVVIHLAARAHVVQGNEDEALGRLSEINVEGTKNLAKQASCSGVKRFIFLSSIKVHGERTDVEPFSIDQTPKPEDSYAISKMKAEFDLWEIEKETDMQVVIIRPPLVYGPGVKGNLLTLVNMVRKGMPLPLGGVHNRRDLVSIYNLCDLIRVCIQHPVAPGNTFLVSDNESMSTTELIRYIAEGLNRNVRLFSVPIQALKIAAGLFGQAGQIEKLTGNLQIDITATQQVLNWNPPLTVTESFNKMFAEG